MEGGGTLAHEVGNCYNIDVTKQTKNCLLGFSTVQTIDGNLVNRMTIEDGVVVADGTSSTFPTTYNTTTNELTFKSTNSAYQYYQIFYIE